MTMMKYRPRHGDSPIDVQEDTPLPVSVMSDVQSRMIVGATGQVSVGTTATLIAPANAKRRGVKITQITGSQVVYLGFTSGVSSTTGDYFSSAAGSSITIYAKGPIWGIAVSVAQTVSYMEESYGE